MADFMQRREVKKKEKKMGARMKVIVNKTKKQDYVDAIDEDKKLINEGQQLTSDLKELDSKKDTRKQVKQTKRDLKQNRPVYKPSSESEPAKSEFNYDDLPGAN
jgi:hypothetical protein